MNPLKSEQQQIVQKRIFILGQISALTKDLESLDSQLNFINGRIFESEQTKKEELNNEAEKK